MNFHMVIFWAFLFVISSLVDGSLIRNIALNKIAEQSSQTDASEANDGNKETDFHSCALTSVGNDTWWRVDLGKQEQIRGVIITSSNREDYILSGIEIWISNDLNFNNSFRCGMIPRFDVGQSLYLPCNGVKGQYVTVSLPGHDRILCLCEVQVFPTDFVFPQPNVAVKGEAAQSSTLFPAVAQRAIDGRRLTFYTESSCSHTGTETAPWWRVDLHQIFIISKIKITNRGDCCPERLDGAEIRIGNSLNNNGNDNPRCTTITHIPWGNTYTFTCESGTMEGRYVNVVIPGDEKILTLCEVEVYGNPAVKPLKDVATSKSAQQTSTKNYFLLSIYWFSASADKAVKLKCIDHTLTKFCCIETDPEKNNLWKVDLGSEHRVTAVVIHNRQDCCVNSIIGARIKIGNGVYANTNPTCAVITSSDLTQTFFCSEMLGRFVSVSIQNNYNKALTFCRVEVYGSPVDKEPVVLPTPLPPTVHFPSVSAQFGDRMMFLVGQKLCWSDALFYCREHHWDLLSVHSPKEQTQVEELLKKSPLLLTDHVWLGLRREVMGLRWFWMSGDTVAFKKWRTSPAVFPNPCGGLEREGGLWRPMPCGELSSFLCQTAPAQPTDRVSYYSSKVKTSL